MKDEHGNNFPVQWKGFNETLNKYQGEVLNKKQIQKRYKQILKLCKEDNSKIGNYDFQDIKSILKMIFNAFN